MTLLGIEPVVAGTVAMLEAGLPAVIDQINAGVTDGHFVDLPTQVVDYVPPPGLLTAYPTVGVSEGTGRPEDDLGHEFTGVNRLTVVAFVQHSDQQALVRVLRRYRLAVMQVLLTSERTVPDVDGPGVAAWGLRLIGVEPGPTLGAMDDTTVREWMSSVRVTIETRSDELAG